MTIWFRFRFGWAVPGAMLLWLLAPAESQAQDSDTSVVTRIHAAVLEGSPEVAAARTGILFAQSRLAAVGFASPVVLSAEAEDIPGGVNLQEASVRLFVEKAFLPKGQRAAERGLAEADLSAARIRLEAIQRVVIARADLALMRAVGSAAIVQRLAEEDALLVSAEASLRSRFVIGEGSYVDVIRLRTERLRVQNQRSASLAASQSGVRAFDALLPPGHPLRTQTLALVESLVTRASARPLLALLPALPDTDSLVDAASVIHLATTAIEQERASRSLLIAQQRPAFSAYLGAQRSSADGGGATYGPVLGGSLSLPFTATRANRAALASADLAISLASAELTAGRAVLRAEILAARDLYQAALSQVAVYDAALVLAARQEREGALAAYRSGQLSLTEFLDFERGLSQAETDQIRNQIAAMESLATLVSQAYSTTDAPMLGSASP